MGFELIFVLEHWRTHRNTEGFHFITASNDAPVIIGEDSYRLILQSRIENTLAGCVEVVAVYEGEQQRAFHSSKGI